MGPARTFAAILASWAVSGGAADAALISRTSGPEGGRDCSGVAPLFDPAVHGPRKVQGVTPYCFPFALGHVLSVVSGMEVNPLDILRKLSEDEAVGWSEGMPHESVPRGLSVALRGGVCEGGAGPVSGPLMKALETVYKRDRLVRLMAELESKGRGPTPPRRPPSRTTWGRSSASSWPRREEVRGQAQGVPLRPFHMGFVPPAGPLNSDFRMAMGSMDGLLEGGSPRRSCSIWKCSAGLPARSMSPP